MRFLSSFFMLSMALDVVIRLIPKILLIVLYFAGLTVMLLIMNEGFFVGLRYITHNPVLSIKYVFGYLKWLYYNQDHLNLVLIIKLFFALCFPYIAYRLFVKFLVYFLNNITLCITTLSRFCFKTLLRGFAMITRLISRNETNVQKDRDPDSEDKFISSNDKK